MCVLRFMKLQNLPFNLIANGQKTVELRLYDYKRKQIAVGDKIEFTNANDDTQKILCKVVDLKVFKDFEELFSSVSPKSCGYEADKTPLSCAKDMNKYYSLDEQKQYGAIAIFIQKI